MSEMDSTLSQTINPDEITDSQEMQEQIGYEIQRVATAMEELHEAMQPLPDILTQMADLSSNTVQFMKNWNRFLKAGAAATQEKDTS